MDDTEKRKNLYFSRPIEESCGYKTIFRMNIEKREKQSIEILKEEV